MNLLCKDCQHHIHRQKWFFQWVIEDHHFCNHNQEVNPVTGDRLLRNCEDYRKVARSTPTCGPEGKFWQARLD